MGRRAMGVGVAWVVLVMGGLVGIGIWGMGHRPAIRPSWKGLTVGRETTLLEGPLLPDGRVDYVRAINQKLGEGVTAENNAFGVLVRVTGLRERDRGEYAGLLAAIGREGGDGLFAPWEDKGAGDETVARRERFYKCQIGPWRAGDAPEVSAWLDRNEEALRVMTEGSRLPHYWVPLVSEDGSLAKAKLGWLMLESSPGEVLRALRARAWREVGEGKLREAHEDVKALLGWYALLQKGDDLIPWLVGMMVGKAGMEVCGAVAGDPRADREMVEAILGELKALRTPATFREVIRRTEVYRFPSAVQEMAMAVKEIMKRKAATPKDCEEAEGILANFGYWLPDWDRMAQRGNRFFAEYFEDPSCHSAAELRAWIRAKRDQEEVVHERANAAGREYTLTGGPGSRFLIPRQGETQASYSDRTADVAISILTPQRATTEDEMALVKRRELLMMGCALRLYKMEHGSYPETLEVAAKEFLGETPIDFWGKPLMYERLEKRGFRVKSIGPLAESEAEAERRGAAMTVEAGE